MSNQFNMASSVMDILQSLRHEGRTLYGYGEPAHPHAAGSASKKKKKQPEKTKSSSSSSSSSSTGGSPASVPVLPESFAAVQLSPDVVASLTPQFYSPQSSVSSVSPALSALSALSARKRLHETCTTGNTWPIKIKQTTFLNRHASSFFFSSFF
jgi:hypothetical protein